MHLRTYASLKVYRSLGTAAGPLIYTKIHSVGLNDRPLFHLEIMHLHPSQVLTYHCLGEFVAL